MTVPGTHQREEFYIEKRHKIVQGYWYVNGKMVRRKLCSFADAGLDDEGWAIVDTEDEEKRRANLYRRRYREVGARIDMEGAAAKVASSSIKTLLQEWMDASTATKSPRTIKEEYTLTANEYIEVNGDHPISDFSLRCVDRLVARLHEKGLAPRTINKRLQTINTFLVWCVEREELVKKPRIKMLDFDTKLPEHPTGEQLRALFARLEAGPARKKNERFYRLHHRAITVAASTGARRAEIFYLPWSKIDFRRGVILVQKSERFTVKERRDKMLPMPPHLEAYLRKERDGNPREVWLLDDGDGRPAYKGPISLTRAIRRHYDVVGIPKTIKPLHGLRAAFADYLLNVQRLPLGDVQKWLGHHQASTTLLYVADEGGRLMDAARHVRPLTEVEKSS